MRNRLLGRFSEIFHRLLRTFEKTHLGFPTEHALSLGDIKPYLFDFAGTTSNIAWHLSRVSDQFLDRIKDLLVGSLYPTRDVEYFSRAVLQGFNIRQGNIVNKYVVPNLTPIAVDHRLDAGQHLLTKDCENSGLTLRTLPWPIHVSVAQDDVLDTIQNSISKQIMLYGVLTYPIWSDWVDRAVLIYGKRCGFTIGRSGCRDIDDTLRAVGDG